MSEPFQRLYIDNAKVKDRLRKSNERPLSALSTANHSCPASIYFECSLKIAPEYGTDLIRAVVHMSQKLVLDLESVVPDSWLSEKFVCCGHKQSTFRFCDWSLMACSKQAFNGIEMLEDYNTVARDFF